MGIRSLLLRTKTMHIPKGMRIATTSLRTGLAMTGRFKTYAPFLAMQKSSPRRALPLLGEVKPKASPFRGKYLEEGMGAPRRDVVQGQTLQ